MHETITHGSDTWIDGVRWYSPVTPFDSELSMKFDTSPEGTTFVPSYIGFKPTTDKGWAVRGWVDYFYCIEGEWGPYGIEDFILRSMPGAPKWLVDAVRAFGSMPEN